MAIYRMRAKTTDEIIRSNGKENNNDERVS